MRPSKREYFLKIASQIATRSTCIKIQLGAIIVDHEGVILSTGYNGPARQSFNCIDLKYCSKEIHNAPSGYYDYCPAIHAEENAVINAARSGVKIYNAVMYFAATPFLTKEQEQLALEWYQRGPCPRCRRVLINAGLSKVISPLKEWPRHILISLDKMWFNEV